MAPSGKFLLSLQTEGMRHLDASWAIYSEPAEHLAPTTSVCLRRLRGVGSRTTQCIRTVLPFNPIPYGLLAIRQLPH